MSVLLNEGTSVGATHTPPAGSDRLAIIMLMVEAESGVITDIVLSGVSATVAATIESGANTGRSEAIAFLPEASFPGGDITVDSVAIDGSTLSSPGTNGRFYVVDGLAQTTFDSETGSYSSTTTTPDLPFSTAAGGFALSAMFTTSAESNLTPPSAYTLDEVFPSNGYTGVAHDADTTDSSDTDTVWTLASERSGEVMFVSFEAAATGPAPGLRHTLKDTDDGTVQANLTGLQVMAFKSVPANPTYQATDGATDGSGVYELNEPSINLNSIAGESLGTTDTNGDLSFTLGAASETLFSEIEAGSISITVGTETITDDGSGNLTGDGSATGTIDYSTGSGSITGAAADTSASGDYDWRQTEIFLTLTDGAGENVAAAWMSVVDLNTSDESVIRTGA